MTAELELRTPQARQRWGDYLSRLERRLRGVAAPLRRSVTVELALHVGDSLEHEPAGSEDEQLERVLQRLGAPEQYADDWLTLAEESGAVSGAWRLRRLAGIGLRSFAAGLLYLIGAYCVLLVALKPFFPDTVGLFALQNGLVVPGYVDIDGSRELLGWWLMPAGLALAVACGWLARRLSRITLHRRSQP